MAGGRAEVSRGVLTVALNAALDVTYLVDELRPYGTHRVREVTTRAGGKAVNVARVLARLGHEVTVTGLAGGPTGAAIGRDLRGAAGVVDRLVPVEADARRTVTVHGRADGGATLFNEPGARVTDGEWSRFLAGFPALLSGVGLVVCSGSLPPGVPEDAYAILVGVAHRHGATAVVDADGVALLSALRAGPDVVKPNADELRAATGQEDAVHGARLLRSRGAGSVVASLGADGLVAVTSEGAWRAVPPRRFTGNPTGAGDACVAALAAGLLTGEPWVAVLADAVALSAAAVAAPVAGEVDVELARRLRPAVRLVPLGGA